MNPYRYLEISSTYRDRTRFPHPAKFNVELSLSKSMSFQSLQQTAMDSVYHSIIKYPPPNMDFPNVYDNAGFMYGMPINGSVNTNDYVVGILPVLTIKDYEFSAIPPISPFIVDTFEHGFIGDTLELVSYVKDGVLTAQREYRVIQDYRQIPSAESNVYITGTVSKVFTAYPNVFEVNLPCDIDQFITDWTLTLTQTNDANLTGKSYHVAGFRATDKTIFLDTGVLEGVLAVEDTFKLHLPIYELHLNAPFSVGALPSLTDACTQNTHATFRIRAHDITPLHYGIIDSGSDNEVVLNPVYPVSSTLNNNTFQYIFPTSLGTVTRDVLLPTGDYTLETFRLALQTRMLANNDYAKDGSSNNVFFIDIVETSTSFQFQWVFTPVPTAADAGVLGYTQPPSGGYPIAASTPQVVLTDSPLRNFLGFVPGTYPSTVSDSPTTVTATSLSSINYNFQNHLLWIKSHPIVFDGLLADTGFVVDSGTFEKAGTFALPAGFFPDLKQMVLVVLEDGDPASVFVGHSYLITGWNSASNQGTLSTGWINDTTATPNKPGVNAHVRIVQLYTNNYRKVVTYDVTTKTATLDASLTYPSRTQPSNVYTITDVIPYEYEVVQFKEDNYYPLDYAESTVHQQQVHCYEISLISLTIPNIPLKTGTGGHIGFYPYVYVEFVSLTQGTSAYNFSSNNPHVQKNIMFKAPMVYNYLPHEASFITLDGHDMVQQIKFKPNDSFSFAVYLPNGELLMTQDDFLSPSEPNPLLQISACFKIKRI